jgi:hypothetical protein
LIKRGLVRKGPEVALPRYITSFKASVERGEHARLLRQIGDHLTDYKTKWADRYEDWARVYGSSKVDLEKSILYGGAALAFRNLTTSLLMNPEAGFIDGANVKTSYLYKMADAYARKRRLAKPGAQVGHVPSAQAFAAELDRQYKCEVSFAKVVDFVTPRLEMFYADLKMEIEPRLPDDDEPTQEELDKANEDDEDELAALAELDDLLGDTGDVWRPTIEGVLSSYPHTTDPDEVARYNGYDDFEAAYAELGEGARWDTDADYTRKAMVKIGKKAARDEDDGLAIF